MKHEACCMPSWVETSVGWSWSSVTVTGISPFKCPAVLACCLSFSSVCSSPVLCTSRALRSTSRREKSELPSTTGGWKSSKMKSHPSFGGDLQTGLLSNLSWQVPVESYKLRSCPWKKQP